MDFQQQYFQTAVSKSGFDEQTNYNENSNYYYLQNEINIETACAVLAGGKK